MQQRRGNAPRKLNLNVPLLSTRRPSGGYISDEVSCMNSLAGCQDSSDGIPFCWEQAPGNPKNSERSSNVDEAETPRPKPPPGRWRPPKGETKGNYDHNHDHHDEAYDANVDDYDDVFSDAVEVLSLTEAMDIVEKTEKFHGSAKSLEPSDLDGLNLAMSLEHSDCPPPTFMIERFLPDAIELAASSALNISKTKLPCLCNYSDQSPCVSQAVIKRPPLSSPKGCGLEMVSILSIHSTYRKEGLKKDLILLPKGQRKMENGEAERADNWLDYGCSQGFIEGTDGDEAIVL
ncbi:Tetratricopeptide repeat (TPR)-containing protein isoform 1 [Hibiscus syriacus]|uniref:Tetratricopeptide repeat (TPR)-containing protein isoform 1 n=1 Tax=Hibiscus syriacus TaxID=106335 RepID=A0A6A3CHV9_HIBSY|nr:Tetratricopeptide repeat (TPR)-containing protein isoform 1 [Hibiscus syriacus]